MSTDIKEVFVDFNELWRGDLHACYPEHVRDRAVLSVGDHVVLTDHEGDYMDGVVKGFENHGRGDLVVLAPVPGSWRVTDAP